MFTGIVEALGKIRSVSGGGNSLSICVECPFSKELTLGESVAVNGVCLTVSKMDESSFFADVTPETFRRTSFSKLRAGSVVNLERAMRADGRFGGHIVSGHIDGTGKMISARLEENAVNVSFSVSKKIGKFVVEKGSVCIDGISLTVASVRQTSSAVEFSVAVIPHTWGETTLSKKRVGDEVNVECDVIGKYVSHFLELRETENQYTDNKYSDVPADFPNFH